MKKNRLIIAILCALTMLVTAFSFGGCSNEANAVFEIIEGTQTARLVSLTGSVKRYTVPETYQGCPVVEIDAMAFTNIMQLESLTVPACVENFPTQNLCWNIRLAEVNYLGTEHYKSVDGVMYSADEKTLLCYPVAKMGESFSIPESVTRIEEGAFQSPKYLKDLTIPTSLNSVGQFGCVFTKGNNSSSLRSVTIGAETIRKIMNTFVEYNDCFILEADELVITGGTDFPDDGLSCFPTATKIRLPEGMKKIGDNFCTSLGNYPIEEVNIPSTVEEIGARFCEFAIIDSITLPEGLKKLGSGSFGFCRFLETLVIPDGVEITPIGDNGSLGICGGEECGLKSLTASLKVASAVDCYEFDLEELIITSLTVDEDGYGYQVNANKVILESNVTSIPDNSINLGSKVQKLEFKGNLTSIHGMFISGSEERTSIIIPESVNYVNATNFETYANTYVTLKFIGSQSDVTVDGEFVENISVEWDYVEESEENEEIEE